MSLNFLKKFYNVNFVQFFFKVIVLCIVRKACIILANRIYTQAKGLAKDNAKGESARSKKAVGIS